MQIAPKIPRPRPPYTHPIGNATVSDIPKCGEDIDDDFVPFKRVKPVCFIYFSLLKYMCLYLTYNNADN